MIVSWLEHPQKAQQGWGGVHHFVKHVIVLKPGLRNTVGDKQFVCRWLHSVFICILQSPNFFFFWSMGFVDTDIIFSHTVLQLTGIEHDTLTLADWHRGPCSVYTYGCGIPVFVFISFITCYSNFVSFLIPTMWVFSVFCIWYLWWNAGVFIWGGKKKKVDDGVPYEVFTDNRQLTLA